MAAARVRGADTGSRFIAQSRLIVLVVIIIIIILMVSGVTCVRRGGVPVYCTMAQVLVRPNACACLDGSLLRLYFAVTSNDRIHCPASFASLSGGIYKRRRLLLEGQMGFEGRMTSASLQ